ncbi:MAG: thiol peroxidase [Spartobacteria bacterium]|nr:thiol peroxidase [Spartobacteria bacterium]
MGSVYFQGAPTHISGKLPAIGSKAPDFKLVKTDLSDLTLDDLEGARVLLNIFPSLDTPVCAASVRRFNMAAGEMKNSKVVCVSRDLPFAQGRYCGAAGLNNVITGSDFRTGDFGKAYGVAITDGPLASLLARAVVILDEQGEVTYTELVKEITDEPDYDAALAILK